MLPVEGMKMETLDDFLGHFSPESLLGDAEREQGREMLGQLQVEFDTPDGKRYTWGSIDTTEPFPDAPRRIIVTLIEIVPDVGLEPA